MGPTQRQRDSELASCAWSAFNHDVPTAYDNITLKTERLTLPHPELFNRAFVLAPLAEIAPDLVIGGVRVGDGAARLGAEAEEVVPLD